MGVVVVAVVVASVDVSVGAVRKVILRSMYPDSPFDPNNWIILVFHESRLSPLNFCSSERIVSEGVDDMVYRGKSNVSRVGKFESF